jgi:formate hydrogenlyase transcriptional activator
MSSVAAREIIHYSTERISQPSLEVEILQNIPAVAWSVTPDGQMEFINRFYLSVTGLRLADCMAPLHQWNLDGNSLPPFLSSLHPDHKERIRQVFWDGIRSRRGWTFEAPFLYSTDRKYHWHLDRAVPVHDQRGNVVRFVGTCANIDELKRAEEKNRALLEISNAITGELSRRPHCRPSPPSYCCPAFDALHRGLCRAMSADWAELSLYHSKADRFSTFSRSGGWHLSDTELGPEIQGKNTSSRWVLEHMQPLVRSHLELEAKFSDEQQLVKAGLNSYVVVPLIHGKICTGVLKVCSIDSFAYSPDEVEVLMEVARQLSLAVENLRAYEEIASLKAKLEVENTYLQEEIRREHNFEEILGNSPALLKLLDRVISVAPTDANVLISGETGSGKELIARAIHSSSNRKTSPLVKVNCGAIPSGLVESELFGHVKGAFTSASERRIGRFELANNGTLFLDEVGELPLDTQVKLLRVLQEQEFEPVGSNRTIKVNVRIIAATNRDLEKAVQLGEFRSDLYYRLNVIPLRLPPLRDRRSDIPLIVMSFLRQSAKRMGKPVDSVSRATMSLLQNYSWPGNIRELQNVIERGVVLSNGPVLRLGPDLLPVESVDDDPGTNARFNANTTDSLEEVQRTHILDVLERTGWVISGPQGAGAILNMHPNTLRSLMNRLRIRRARRPGASAESQTTCGSRIDRVD